MYNIQAFLFLYRFRKIPGDKCQNGFKPTSKLIDLNKVCDEFGNKIVGADEQEAEVNDVTLPCIVSSFLV